MNIKDLRLQANMTQQEFSDHFNIPKRSIENWESGLRTPPTYVTELIKFKLEKENGIMTRKEIEALENEIVTEKQFEQIEEHEDVERVDNNGSSGNKPGCTWYTVYFTDGEELDIYYEYKD